MSGLGSEPKWDRARTPTRLGQGSKKLDTDLFTYRNQIRTQTWLLTGQNLWVIREDLFTSLVKTI